LGTVHRGRAVSFELGYTFIPANDIIEHEISDSYLGAYFF